MNLGESGAPVSAPEVTFTSSELERLKRTFREAYTASEESRRRAEEEGRYYDGPCQLSAEVRAKLRILFGAIPLAIAAIRVWVGLFQQEASGAPAKAKPVGPQTSSPIS